MGISLSWTINKSSFAYTKFGYSIVSTIIGVSKLQTRRIIQNENCSPRDVPKFTLYVRQIDTFASQAGLKPLASQLSPSVAASRSLDQLTYAFSKKPNPNFTTTILPRHSKRVETERNGDSVSVRCKLERDNFSACTLAVAI